MESNDNMTLKGTFALKVFNAKGELLEEYQDENLIVSGGKNCLAILLSAANANKRVTKIGFGTDATSPSSGDVGLTSSYVKAIDSYSTTDVTSVVFSWTLGTSEANGKAIQEFGLIAVDNTLFARKTRSVINKTSDLRLEGTWRIQF